MAVAVAVAMRGVVKEGRCEVLEAPMARAEGVLGSAPHRVHERQQEHLGGSWTSGGDDYDAEFSNESCRFSSRGVFSSNVAVIAHQLPSSEDDENAMQQDVADKADALRPNFISPGGTSAPP